MSARGAPKGRPLDGEGARDVRNPVRRRVPKQSTIRCARRSGRHSGGASRPGSRSSCSGDDVHRMVVAPAVVRVAVSVHVQRLRPQRHRDARAASRLRAVPRLRRVPVRRNARRAIASRAGLAARAGRRVLRRLPVRVLHASSRRAPACRRTLDFRRGDRRHAAAARGNAARRRSAARDHRRR